MASQRLIDQHGPRIRELAEAGKSRNDIARELELSAGSVTAIAKAIGVSFDRTATAQAVHARAIDCRARRVQLSERLLNEAENFLDQLHKPFLAFAFGGRDNTYNSHELPGPPTGDARNLMQAASTAIGRHLDLVKHDADGGAEAERSLLTKLGEALGVTGPPAA